MATEVKKIKELEYDEIITLGVIEKDEDLSSIFTEEIGLTFNVLRTLSKENRLSDDTKNFIRDLFDKVILTKNNLINYYINLAEADGKYIKIIDDDVLSVIPTLVTTKEINKDIVKTPKKEKLIPRRYGKANIEKDIKSQNGKATNVQLTALAVNDLKNIYVKLSNRLVKDMLSDKTKLTDEDYREIRSLITLVKNKTKIMLQKK